MKTKINFGRWAVLLLMVLFYIFAMGGCKHKAQLAKGHIGPDPNNGCKVIVDGDGLYNCKKTNCTGPCVMQIKNPGKKWRDIPGGNVNPDDVGDEDTIRCVCDTTKKKG